MFLGYVNTKCGKIIIEKDGRKYKGYLVYSEKDNIIQPASAKASIFLNNLYFIFFI